LVASPDGEALLWETDQGEVHLKIDKEAIEALPTVPLKRH
jgi:hypothetical protein